jgi:hypothetical protein
MVWFKSGQGFLNGRVTDGLSAIHAEALELLAKWAGIVQEMAR